MLLLLLRSIREPGRLLVQKPQICTPQERVKETNDDRNVGLLERSSLNYATAVDICVDIVFIVPFANRTRTKNPIVRVCGVLHINDSVGPCSTCGQPKNGQDCRQAEIHHRCFLLLRHVQVGKENIDCKADHCTQKGDDAHEDEELGIGGEVSWKVHLEFLGFATCVDGWFMI